jgi:hypothetical protein
VPLDTHEEYTRRLLDELDSSEPASQRAISRNLGIALGLTNLLIRRFVSKGLVRVTEIKPHRVRYLLTPAGIAEKARLSQAAFQNSVERYRVARDRVQAAFSRISEEWPEGDTDKRLLFYGTGEVAEIGYICLQQTDLRLTGAIDDQGRTRFFGVPVLSPAALPAALPDEARGAQVIVMSLAQSDRIRQDLAVLGEAGRRAVWI